MALYQDAPYLCILQDVGRLNVYLNADDRPVCGDAYVGYEGETSWTWLSRMRNPQ